MYNNVPGNPNQSPYTTEQLLFALQQSQNAHPQAMPGQYPGYNTPAQAMNPAFFNQFLQTQQQLQTETMIQFQHAQAFEAIQRLQALAVAQEEESAAMQAVFLAQQQQQQAVNMANGMPVNMYPNQTVPHQQQQHAHHQPDAMETDQMQQLKVATSTAKKQPVMDSQSTVDSALGSALGSASSGSSSPAEEGSNHSSISPKGQLHSPSVAQQMGTPALGSSGVGPKLPVTGTSQLQKLVAAKPTVHVPCTAKCYHRCKLGLSCPRHQHKHLEKLKRKQKQADDQSNPQSSGSSSNVMKCLKDKKKSLETSSASCISVGSNGIDKLDTASDGVKRTFLDLYEVYNVIGVGGGGMVYSGRRIADKIPVAIKRVMREKVKRWEQVQGHNVPQEIALMLRCYGHPGVIRLVDWYECLDSFILIMERPERAVDLFDYIREVGRMKEPQAAKVFKQVLDATIHIQNCNVVHRDIKDENVIIDRDTGAAKLIDFGCGTILRDTAYRDFSGTPEFYPPEWFTQREYYARTAAVWSLGVLLFDMLIGEIPFKQKEKIVENQPVFKHQISTQARHLIEWLMSTDPAKRPTLADISSHSWMAANL